MEDIRSFLIYIYIYYKVADFIEIGRETRENRRRRRENKVCASLRPKCLYDGRRSKDEIYLCSCSRLHAIHRHHNITLPHAFHRESLRAARGRGHRRRAHQCRAMSLGVPPRFSYAFTHPAALLKSMGTLLCMQMAAPPCCYLG